MTFDDNITTREQGTSAELYVFSFSNGTILYFMSFERDLLTTETPDGHAYTHIPIQRGEFELDTELASNKITITAPVLNTFANDLVLNGQINVSIVKVFLADKTHQSIFNGLILSIEKNIGEAIAQCCSRMYYLEKELPRVFFQAPCNNTLFDSKCVGDGSTGMVKANFQFTFSVTVSNNGYTLTISHSDYESFITAYIEIGGVIPPDGTGILKGLFTLGQAAYAGEIRYITNYQKQTISGLDVGVLQLHYPFTGVKTGTITGVVLTVGCDKTGAFCAAVLGTGPFPPGNIVNFTGFPYMPATDPTVMAVGT